MDNPKKAEATDNSARQRRCSFITSKDIERVCEEQRLKQLQKIYSERWHENETSIVIKMLDRSMRDNDHETTIELKRTLLELERRSGVRSAESSPENLSQPELSRNYSFSIIRGSESPKKFSRSDGTLFSPKEMEYLDKAIMQNTKQYDNQLTIMLIGNQEVGKTSLMNAWLGLKWQGIPQHTIGYV
jgi:polynucleotide 5'-kinase involved in rRNA processing